MPYVTVGKGNGWSVARSRRATSSDQVSVERVPSLARAMPIFSARLMPDGSIVRELDRTVHEQALKAANRKLRTLLNKR